MVGDPGRAVAAQICNPVSREHLVIYIKISGIGRRLRSEDYMRSVSEYLWRAQRADVEMRLELGHCRRVDHSSRPQRINANSSAIFTCDSKHNHAHPELGHSISDVRREPALLH